MAEARNRGHRVVQQAQHNPSITLNNSPIRRLQSLHLELVTGGGQLSGAKQGCRRAQGVSGAKNTLNVRALESGIDLVLQHLGGAQKAGDQFTEADGVVAVQVLQIRQSGRVELHEQGGLRAVQLGQG